MVNEFYIKNTKETATDAIKKLSKYRLTEHYVIPKRLKFPREMKKNEYFGRKYLKVLVKMRIVQYYCIFMVAFILIHLHFSIKTLLLK